MNYISRKIFFDRQLTRVVTKHRCRFYPMRQKRFLSQKPGCDPSPVIITPEHACMHNYEKEDDV